MRESRGQIIKVTTMYLIIYRQGEMARGCRRRQGRGRTQQWEGRTEGETGPRGRWGG